MKKLELFIASVIIALCILVLKSYAGENMKRHDLTSLKKSSNEVSTYGKILEAMTDQEYDEMQRIMFLECRGEPLDGKYAVAEVIFNRVLSEDFPDTVHDVLSQTGQFSTWHYVGQAYYVDESAEDIAKAKKDIYLAIVAHYNFDNIVLPDMNYIFFDTKGKNGKEHIHIGNHYFGK